MFGWKSQSQRFRELEEAIRSLKRQIEERDLDWVDMRSRCKRLLDRTEKAARRLTEEELDSPAAQPQGNGEMVPAAAGGRLLTSRQMEIQQQILKRRSGQ